MFITENSSENKSWLSDQINWFIGKRQESIKKKKKLWFTENVSMQTKHF